MFNVENMLGDVGVMAALIIIGCLIFAECAFLIGLLVPGGDVLLLVAGVFAAQGDLPLVGVLVVVFVAATVGYEVGYSIGAKTGPQIFKQKAGMLFRKEHADRATKFYAQHGGKTVLVARFIGYVRTIAPLLAGIAGMQRRKFIIYNIAGALLWALSLVMLGYWFGSAFTEEIKRYMMPLTLVGLVLLCGGAAIHFLRHKYVK